VPATDRAADRAANKRKPGGLTERFVELHRESEYFKALAAERVEQERDQFRQREAKSRVFATARRKWIDDTVEALGRGNAVPKLFVTCLRFNKDTFLTTGDLWSGDDLQNIAKRMGYSARTVQRTIPVVVATGLLRVVRPLNPRTGQYEHNRYQAICKPEPPDDEAPF
jgi:hypothetical protein